MIATQAQLASILNVSAAAISKWQKQPGWPAPHPKNGPGSPTGYDTGHVIQWLIDKEVAAKAGPDSLARLRWTSAKANLAEVKLAERCGELVQVAEVTAAFQNLAMLTREAILAVPSRVSSLVAAEADAGKVESLLAAELHAALTKLSEQGEKATA